MPSQNTGTLIGSTIRPFSTESKIATALSNEVKGGLHSVADSTERNSITTERRQFGMIVYVVADNKYYQLRNISSSNLYDNANWDELNILSTSLISTFDNTDWQNSIISLASSYSTTTLGDRYIISSGFSFPWAGHDSEIAEWNGTSWDFTLPQNGMTVRVDSDYGAFYVYEGEYPIGSWVYYSNEVLNGTGITVSYSGTLPVIGINLISGTGINTNFIGNDYEIEYVPQVYYTTNSGLLTLIGSASLVPGWIYNVTDVGSQNDLTISLMALSTATISKYGQHLDRYIEYDITNNWITKMVDTKGNELSCSFETYGDLSLDPYLTFDWNNPNVTGNKVIESVLYLKDIYNLYSGTTFSGSVENCVLQNKSLVVLSEFQNASNSISNCYFNSESGLGSSFSATHSNKIEVYAIGLQEKSNIYLYEDTDTTIGEINLSSNSVLNIYGSVSSVEKGNISSVSSLNVNNSTFSYFNLQDNYTYSVLSESISEFYVDKKSKRYHTESYTSSTVTVSFTFSNPHYVGITGSSPKQVNLPDGTVEFKGQSNDGRVVIIKDESGNCSAYPITINPYGTQRIDNAGTSSVLAINYGSLSLLYRGGNWWII